MNNLSILLTGGTGSFGNKFVEMTLKKYNPKKLIIFSRDEMKQWHMAQKFDDERLRFFLGDIRDKDRLNRAADEVDVIIHAAALKIVPTAEYNPFESVKTNIIGAMNLIDVAIEKRVKKVIALSTDKACDPINFYGATKLASDKLFIAGNNYVGLKPTSFSIVRYGNVIGSRGSVIPFFLKLKNEKKQLTITDNRMTRFFTTLDDAVKMVWTGLKVMKGGEIFVLKNPSIKILELAKTIDKNPIKEIGIRPGEKINEVLISREESANTYDCGSYYSIMSTIIQRKKPTYLTKSKKVKKEFEYSSNKNRFLNSKEIKRIIEKFKKNN
jgi:UDP-N-acetylglucosamine 4,6-dehydratase/5-epimerase